MAQKIARAHAHAHTPATHNHPHANTHNWLCMVSEKCRSSTSPLAGIKCGRLLVCNHKDIVQIRLKKSSAHGDHISFKYRRSSTKNSKKTAKYLLQIQLPQTYALRQMCKSNAQLHQTYTLRQMCKSKGAIFWVIGNLLCLG